MRSFTYLAACAAVTLVAGCGSGGDSPPAVTIPEITMKVLSGPPDYVSGGDTRIEVSASSTEQVKLEFWLNDKQIAPVLKSSGDRMEGLVTGLVDSANTLELRHKTYGKLSSIKLTNYPITGRCFPGRSRRRSSAPPISSTCSRWLMPRRAGYPVYRREWQQDRLQPQLLDGAVRHLFLPQRGGRQIQAAAGGWPEAADLARTNLTDGPHG